MSFVDFNKKFKKVRAILTHPVYNFEPTQKWNSFRRSWSHLGDNGHKNANGQRDRNLKPNFFTRIWTQSKPEDDQNHD